MGQQKEDFFPQDCQPQAGPDGSDMPRAAIKISFLSRRTFIEMIGFSVAAAALSGCRPPTQKIIPYVNQPVELTPGIANWYASTCGGCSAACGTLIKVRDGRPIKLEGNPDHPLSKGGLCAVAHAMVFELFDSERLRQPLIASNPADWQRADVEIIARLASIKESGGKVRVLTPDLNSPTSKDVIAAFLKQFSDGKHVVYKPMSLAAIARAHSMSHGVAANPLYHFDKAKLIVGFDADFLGTWISPAQFARDYTTARRVEEGRRENEYILLTARHIQFESRMSLTGSKADTRIRVSPAEQIQALLLLAKLVAEKTRAIPEIETAIADRSQINQRAAEAIERVAQQIVELQGESLVVCGSNDSDAQYLVNLINAAAGSYGKTIEIGPAISEAESGDHQMAELVKEMKAGEVAALVMIGVNPAYDYHAAREFAGALDKVPLKVSLNSSLDETAALSDYACPQSHFLESWNDARRAPGVLSLSQPAIAPIFQTRPYQESLLRWSGDQRSFYEVLRESWRERFFSRQKGYATFDEFWDRTLHDGAFILEGGGRGAEEQRSRGAREQGSRGAIEAVKPEPEHPRTPAPLHPHSIGGAAERLRSKAIALAGGLSVVLYEKVSLRDGAHANNPWLHELPDPITKITWDNYAQVSPSYAEKMGLEEGQIVRVSRGETSIEIPVHIQPGHHDDCVSVALGYGRTKAGKAGNGVGVNAYPFVAFEDETFQYTSPGITLEKTSRCIEFAKTQVQDTLEGKPIIKEISLDKYLEGQALKGGEHGPEAESLWPGYEYNEHKWGMVVDLDACTGCSACILSCQAENNVPVVGKDEVRRRREMHWLRIDRYYEGQDETGEVHYQPIMCQQCDNASCESVCPVLATVHSSEGLNMQVYNRCVGTRYCENNCAYKVRRFNWFEYPHDDAIANLALNPDVTVRSRGVMEKCTFCVQRIEEAKIRARNEGRAVRDGEIQTACQQSCPAQAITFGNVIDSESRVARLKRDHRNYVLLEQLNLRPPTSYLAKVKREA